MLLTDTCKTPMNTETLTHTARQSIRRRLVELRHLHLSVSLHPRHLVGGRIRQLGRTLPGRETPSAVGLEGLLDLTRRTRDKNIEM